MQGMEGIGEAVTGGLAARAVEPHAGEAGHGHTGGETCLNCGTGLIGDYCHRCGQQGHVHRSLHAFWHDLAHSVLHFEGKIWRTLPLLAWRPGVLTRRYIAGERARFVSPMALFLFSVFLMFAVFNTVGGPIDLGESKAAGNFDSGMAEAIQENEKSVASLERQRAETVAAGRRPDALDARIKEARDELAMLRLMRERGITEATMTRASDDLPEAPGWLGNAYKKAKANPSLLIYKLQNNAYKFSWALIPISVPFVWLLFPFSRRFRLYDHTVFVTYSLCFMTLLVIALSLLRVAGLGPGTIMLALTFIPPFHMYKQLRHAYRLTRFGALWRTFLLMNFAGMAAGLFFTLLLSLGLLG
jgi:hypothetical protein